MASFSVFGFAARNEFIESAFGFAKLQQITFQWYFFGRSKGEKERATPATSPTTSSRLSAENPIKSIRNQVSSWLLHYINFSFSEDSRLLIRDGNSTARFYATISVTDFFGNSRHKSSKTNQNGFSLGMEIYWLRYYGPMMTCVTFKIFFKENHWNVSKTRRPQFNQFLDCLITRCTSSRHPFKC